jgi:UvrD-like helicase C-terminal domain/UvrD/REP helicase N-terminal domain
LPEVLENAGDVLVVAAASSVQAEIDREQRYVDDVYARLAAMVERAEAIARDGRARGRLGYTGEIKEDDYRSLFERDVMVDHAVRRLAVLDAQREGLVFGRLDHRGGEVRYVGRIGVRDAEHEPLVIDWRAPAAAVFYQATAADPRNVVRRRVLRCQGQRVVGVEDDLLDPGAAPPDLAVVGDGALIAALSAARGRQMRDIVATIQREQDEIIRAQSSGATLISGGPGTGKTVVALHRAAYLLYTERRRIAGGGILVVGPSPVFMSYIERVLPSLGEREAVLRSVGEVFDGTVARRSDGFAAAHVKGSLRMRRVLSRAARAEVPGAPEELRLYAGGRQIRVGARVLADVRQQVLRRGARRNRARGDVVRALLDLMWRQAAPAADGERTGRLSADGRTRADFDEDVRDRDAFVDFVDRWWPVVTAHQVLGWLTDRDRLARAAAGVLRPAEIETLANSWAQPSEPSQAAPQARSLAQPPAQSAMDGYTVQDVPLLDELHALLGEPPRPVRPPDPYEYDGVREVTTAADRDGTNVSAEPAPHPTAQYDGYAHVLVDEAQDLSPMQWRMLGRRGRHASWTIVGDAAQSSWPDRAEAEQAQDAALGRRPRRAFQLTTNYRNSREIFELAATVIRHEFPDAPLPEAVRATGHEPEDVVVGDARLADEVRRRSASLLEEVDGTVGVILPTARQDEGGAWLETQTAVAGERLVVTSGLASKGLEFDGVLLVEPLEIAGESPVGTRTLYVALTRATQRLVTIGTTPSWFSQIAR